MAYTTIDKPDLYFNTKLYAGNSGTQSITGVNFQPDFLWIKRRTLAGDHNLVDVIRTSDKTLISNDTGAEYSNSTITSFDSDGFSLSGSDGALNGSGSNYVAWNWLASNTTASNTQGDITSTVSANTTSGFSIVKYTGNAVAGATIGHGLGVVPKMIIVKKLNGSPNWAVYHASTTDFRYYLELNTTSATQLDSAVFDNVPTSSTFLVGSDNKTNGSSGDYIAYCFAEKKGFSKFGSYIASFISGQATPNATGTPFVYTGFKPAFIMIKNSSSAENWVIFDNKRSPQNASYGMLFPNSNVVENTSEAIDIYSNGFKPRSNSGYFTVPAGDKFIYMAFAEQPFVTSTGIPTTAR